MKKTKIICTIGPASNSPAILKKLYHAGMNVVRINMSHGNHEYAQKIVNNAIKFREQNKKSLALLIDTKGPEIRIKTFKNSSVELIKGQDFTFTSREVEGDETIVSLKYKQLVGEIKVGQKIFANNAMIILKVKAKTETDIICKVVFGGKLSNNKGLNIPGITPSGDFLSQADKEDLLFAIKNNANYIAASFVAKEKNVLDMRKFLDDNGGKDIKIISKIENDEGVRNLEKIIQSSDGLMVARGDLGVEIPISRLKEEKKKSVELSIKYGKIVVIATEMLESMVNSSRPTRAEVSDVANAVYEMASSTMLSAESAVGINPVNVVTVMNNIHEATEKSLNYDKHFMSSLTKATSITDAISQSVCTNAIALKAKLIVVFTHSGESARLLSKYRIKTPILAVTPSDKVFHNMALTWGVQPFKLEKTDLETEEKMQEYAKELAIKLKFAKKDDIIIVQHGRPGQQGSTDMLKVLKI